MQLGASCVFLSGDSVTLNVTADPTLNISKRKCDKNAGLVNPSKKIFIGLWLATIMREFFCYFHYTFEIQGNHR